MNSKTCIRKPSYFQAGTKLNRAEQLALTLLILGLTALALFQSQ